MTTELQQIIRLTQLLAGVAVVVGTLELLVVRRAWSDLGIWRWSVLRREMSALGVLLGQRSFTAVLLVRLAAGVALIAGAPAVGPLVAWITSLLVNLRFRGTYNGGSDHMLMIVLTALVITSAGAHSEVLVKAAVVWIGVQSILSYAIAGVAKLVHRSWRNGEAMRAFAGLRAYGAPALASKALGNPAVARYAAWSVLLFECGFPAVLLGPRVAVVFIAMAAVFHMVNAGVLGLNRFLLTWAATWPAVWHVATLTGAR